MIDKNVERKYEGCPRRRGTWCEKLGHDVGVNGYSIMCHCSRCDVMLCPECGLTHSQEFMRETWIAICTLAGFLAGFLCGVLA